MKINWLSIKDFRGFRDCEITFPNNSNIVVFIGINGAGKSAVLDAISILLNVIVKDICSQRRTSTLSYKELSQDDINLNAKRYRLEIQFNKGNNSLDPITNPEKTNNIHILYRGSIGGSFYRDFVEKIKSDITESELLNLPIFVYYSINRNMIDNIIKDKYKNKLKYQYPQYFAYESSLDNHINSFNDFIQWFRQEEDLENQLQRDNQDFGYRNESLEIIRSAINKFLNQFGFAKFSNLRIQRERVNNDHRITLNQALHK